MNNEILKNAVIQVIKTNGNNEITGSLLQQVLVAMINGLGLGYQYIGIATPDMDPDSPDQRVMYLATQAGTYSNFGTPAPVLDGNSVYIFTYADAWTATELDIATKSNLSAYLAIADLASETGQSTTTTMTQKAITDALLGLAEDIETTVAQAMQEHVAKLPELTVGSSAGVLGRTVDASFLFRRTAGTAKIGRGAAALNAIYGRTLVWNQKMGNDTGSQTVNGITITQNSDGSVSADGTATADVRVRVAQSIIFFGEHKFYISGSIGGSVASFYLEYGNVGSVYDGGVIANKSFGSNCNCYLNVKSGVTISNKKFYPQLTDLTLMFGSGDEPATVDEFEALYPGYHSNNAGAQISNDAAALEAVGFNQWGEVWEVGNISNSDGSEVTDSGNIRSMYERAIPGATYYINTPNALRLWWYDADKNAISGGVAGNGSTQTAPANAAFFRFGTTSVYGSTYNRDICINLFDPAKNGTYEPHWSKYLPLNLSTRTGKLNGQGASVVVFPDGLKSAGSGANMVQDSTDGITATKRVGTRAYQTGDENDSTLTTDGTNTNYPLAAAETYVLDEPLQMSYQVEDGGTEQAVAPGGATLPSAPFMAQIQYPLDVIALQGDSLADMLDAMVAAGVITTYTMTYNVAAQKYEFTINGVSRNLPENNRKGGGNDEPNDDEPTDDPGNKELGDEPIDDPGNKESELGSEVGENVKR